MPSNIQTDQEQNSIQEEGIQQIISSSMKSYKASMAATNGDQIITDIRNLNIFSCDPREEPQLEWDSDKAHPQLRISNAWNNSQRSKPLNGRSHHISLQI